MELNKRLRICRESLTDLGASRDTSTHQSKYLIDIATRFQEVAGLALDAKYWGNDIFNRHPSLKLATLVIGRSEIFSKTVQANGHTYRFETESDGSVFPRTATAIKYHPDGKDPIQIADNSKHITTRVVENHTDVEDILHEEEILTSPENGRILEWLTKVYCASRGFELGTFDPSLLAIAMREQSKNWDCIAFGYISDVVTIVHGFVTNLPQVICPDERVRSGLTSMLVDGLRERYRKAIDQVAFVLQVEPAEKPTTQNHHFNNTLEKWYGFFLQLPDMF